MLSRTRSRRAHAKLTAAIAVSSALALAAPASAATFTVDVTGDASDTNLDDNACDTTPVIEPSARAPFPGLRGCTLRAAIQESNDTRGVDAVHFNIPGGGVKTIAPNSQLPSVEDLVTIDGYTQPGASPNTKAIANGNDAVLLIELSGANTSAGTSGLSISPGGGGSVVKGLVINRFSTGILGSPGRIEGNFIGIDPSGTIDRGNDSYGILITDGTTVVGGSSRSARNVISGNGSSGILTFFERPRVVVQGNHIGTAKGGAAPLRNGGDGLSLSGPTGEFLVGNEVGGAGDAANVIAFNGGDGIGVSGSEVAYSRFTRNRIFSNGEQGIDLGSDGTTRNDGCDADTGPNHRQNFPVISSAVTDSGRTTVAGALRSTPNVGFTLEFFRNPPGEGEGQRFIGAVNVTTNANCEASFSTQTSTVAVGDNITATATNSVGDTSEFSSSPRTVVAGP